MKPPCCMKRFDRTVVMEYHRLMHHLSSFKIPGSAGISVPIWGLRNLLNDPRVRIDKVKVATVFSTLFPTLCLFRKAWESVGRLSDRQPLAAVFVCKACTS